MRKYLAILDKIQIANRIFALAIVLSVSGFPNTKVYRKLLFIAAVMIAFVWNSSAHAIPVMDLQPEDLMAQASDVKKSLNLNPNQQVFWQQIETKIRAILTARLRRREQLQFDLKRGFDDSRTELRNLAKEVEVEAD